jgi:hypothetical protein
MQLNEPLYNSELLGSGSATNSYGGAVVFSGSITQSCVCVPSITIAPNIWHAILSGVQQCLGWMRDSPTRAAPGELFTAVSVSGSLQARRVVRESGIMAPSVSGAVTPRIVVWSMVSINQAMRVVGTCDGDDLSRTPAPADRVSYVPASERTSYAQVN